MRMFTNHNDQVVSICLILALSLVSFGCRPSHQRDTAPVRGHVTVDGSPATSGFILITPKSGRQARGAIQRDGSFVMGTYKSDDGVQLGTHPVIVHSEPADESSATSLDGQGPAIPERYGKASTSKMQIEVTSEGKDNWLLDLHSR